MIRAVFAMTILLAALVSPHARAGTITLKFAGTIDSVVDAFATGLPPIDFTPIPVGSTFSGTLTYDTSSPQTGGLTGYARYDNLANSAASVTINGHDFAATGSVFAAVTSREAGFLHSGTSFANQPIDLPTGWDVVESDFPYFTLQFWDGSPLTRPLDLPLSASELPTAYMRLILDFQQPVTIEGQVYGGRVLATGTITDLSAAAVPEPSSLAVFGIGACVAGVGVARRRRLEKQQRAAA